MSINGQRQRISYRLDRQKIDASQVLTAQGGTAFDVLRAVPGVVVDADGSLSYRGSQEFLVYVDGKPSPLSGTEALQMIGASSRRDIEILTTPSAKYKTEGDVGIINIVTKRSETDGWDIALNGTASTWGTLSLDTKINYRTGHHNIYVGGQGSDIHNKSQFQQEKTTSAKGTTVTSFADGTRFRDFRTYIGQGGYEFNDGWHRLGIDLQGGRTINPRGGDMTYNTSTTTGSLPSINDVLDSHDRYKLTKKLFQTAIDYTWKLNERGDEINISNRFRYDRFSEEYTESNMFDLNGARQEGTRGYETEHHWDCDGAASYKLHYRPTGTLELGYQYTTYSEHGDYRICYWDLPSQNFVWQDDLYAPFYYRRQTHSEYAQVNDRIGPLQFDAGLRIDHLIDEMDLPTITSRYKKYTELYPSAHLAYTTNKAGTFTLGYSRRTNRPGIWKLEPYITYEDYHTRIIGNPDLKSEYIHSMELAWRKMFGQTQVTATFYARRRTGVVDYVRRAYDAGVTLDSIINAGNGWRKAPQLSGQVRRLHQYTQHDRHGGMDQQLPPCKEHGSPVRRTLREWTPSHTRLGNSLRLFRPRSTPVVAPRQTAAGTCRPRHLPYGSLPQPPHLNALEQRDMGAPHLPQHRLQRLLPLPPTLSKSKRGSDKQGGRVRGKGLLTPSG